MADLSISVDIDARGARVGGATAKSEIKAVGDEAEKTGRKIKSAADRDFEALNKQLQDAQEWSDALTKSIGLMGAGMLIAATAAALLAAGIFKLSQAFAAYAKEIGRAHEMTGLSTELLSALRMQVEKTGDSFDDLGSGLKEFIKTIGDANNGSKEASARLVRLGIDSKKAAGDLDGAFRDVLQKIVSLPKGVQQANAAMDAFGKEIGLKLIPFINSFNGDMDALIGKAKEFAVVISEEDVRAAKEFDDAIFTIQTTVKGLALTFGRELLPEVERVLDGINKTTKNNREETQTWAEATGAFLHRLISIYGEAADGVEKLRKGTHELQSTYNTLTTVIVGGMPGLSVAVYLWERFAQAVTTVSQKGRAEINADPLKGTMGGSVQTGSYFIPPTGKAPRAAKPEISDEAKQAERLATMLRDAQIELQFFGQKSEEAATRQQLLKMGIFATNQALADQLINLAKDTDVKIANAKATEEAAAAAKKHQEAIQQINDDIVASTFSLSNDAAQQQIERRKRIDLGRELNQVELTEIAIAREIVEFAEKTKDASLEEAKALYAVLDARHKVMRALAEGTDALNEEYEAQQRYKNLIQDLDDEYLDLTIQLREYTTGVAATRVEVLLLSEAYQKLTPEQQEAARKQAEINDGLRAAIKAQEEYRRAYEDTFNVIRDSLGILAEDGFGAFFKDIGRRFKNFLLDMAAQWLTSKFFELFYKGGNQKQAAGAISTGGSGGIIGAISSIFGGQGQGPGGTGVFNPGYFVPGGSGSDAGLPTWSGTGLGRGPTLNGSAAGGGILSQIFGKGGIFGAKGFGANVGTFTGIGTIGAILGGAIGGRAGGFISNIGTGVALGAQIGSIIPGIGTVIGAAVGGVVGFFASLFGGNKQEKRDKKEKMPELTKGFTEALAQLRALAADRNALMRDPGGVLNKAMEIRTQIAGGFGIQFESRKYQRESQSQISQRLVEADAIIAEIKKLSEISYAAGDRDRRLLPEFAGGVYMSPAFQNFRRRNGMLGGVFTGRDTIPAMLAHGEAVLNPRQMQTIRSHAGFDVFKTAGIPGYAGGGMAGSQGVSGGAVVVQVSLSQDAAGMWHATAKSDSGRKVLLEVVSDGFANDEITTRRR